ncbi:MAG: hypothetical protein U1F11_14090 [Steroidobacteraceae bacterium]
MTARLLLYLGSLDERTDEFLHRHRIELPRVPEQFRGSSGLRGLHHNAAATLDSNPAHQHRHALGAPPPVADREIHLHPLAGAAVAVEHLHGVADVALVGGVVLRGEHRVLAQLIVERSASTCGSAATPSS